LGTAEVMHRGTEGRQLTASLARLGMRKRLSLEFGDQDTAGPSDSETGRASLEKFLLAEYEHIAQAHFNTVVAISQFFQYYVLIASVPISAAVAFGKFSEWGKDAKLKALLEAHPLVIPLALTILALVGLSVMGYLVNLRHDALLYARTVNGIRRRFLEGAGIPIQDELRFRVLPRSTYLPQYTEPWYFGFVVLAFMLIDTAYAVGGWWAFGVIDPADQWTGTLACVIAVSVVLHSVVYWGLAGYREFSYLRGHVIGVDVDGVLGMHREQFCEVLRDVCGGPELDPGRLDRIPVRDCSHCKGLGVGEDEEVLAFHEPCYWTEMSPYPDAASELRKLHDVLGYRVLVFSWRPWPNWSRMSESNRDYCLRCWTTALLDAQGLASGWRRAMLSRLYPVLETKRAGFIIARLTRIWLNKAGIPFDSLTVEKGNVYSPYPRGRVVNRFVAARRHEMRVFVEDDLAKAIRLAGICEVVFLIDQPYNQAAEADVPSNLIRVRTWPQIHQFVRENL